MNIIKTLLIMESLILTMPCPGLSPIIKWAGGKERELPYIVEYAPKEFDRYFEPFVGGGSVFAAISAKEYYVNDKSDELIALYMAIKTGDQETFKTLAAINESWKNVFRFTSDRMLELSSIYLQYRTNDVSDAKVKDLLCKFIDDNFPMLIEGLGRTDEG